MQANHWSKRALGMTVGLLGVLGVACGSEMGEVGPGEPEADPNIGAQPPAGQTGLEACATAQFQGESAPIYLVFFVDKSGSMGFNPTDNHDYTAEKWTPVKSALSSFFGQAKTNTFASLEVFPIGSGNQICETAQYTTPEVGMKALPDSTTFQTALDGITPAGNTPTRPALKAAYAYANGVHQKLIDNGDSGKVAVVVATDGEPYGCNHEADNTIANIAADAGQIASKIPTYVIGVGKSLQALHTIAQWGGTKQATLVPVSNPSQTAADFSAALETVRTNAIACSLALPPLQPGQKLDVKGVNVTYTDAAGNAEVLPYDPSCQNDKAWHYDDPEHPTRIELCDNTCSYARSGSAGVIDLVLGCMTREAPPVQTR